MHGREGEEARKQLGSPHMRTVPQRLGAPRDSDGSLSSTASSSPSFFFKDGRKISVGDSALFKLLPDSPPSVGIICWVTITKEKNLKLGVNWLYRPTEVKLGKDVLLEAAPNEIFYSLKKNEIPASSLLHPCKVAFLAKGVELPSGVSSFVCRRVYDITSRHLWWLTDKDYFNERQEEVEQLLYKTRIEMHASAQPNGRSPKQTSGSMSTPPLKPGSDSLQNSSSLPSQGKGKKRERADQNSDPAKRERSSKTGDGDSGRFSSENLLKLEIGKVVEKGPLVDTEGVDRLVQVMFIEVNERKIDLSARTMLTNIIVATEKSECLSRFVQIRGLSILDDWLQDVHKGRTNDSSGPRDNDKMAEEFLLVLLRALDKLPVNLPALQMCNIGKSVNHLRTHKNVEIQKKARSLVDTWKKRVEAEMNMNDAKVGSDQAVSWSARSRLPEVAQLNRNQGGSSDGAPKSPSVQLSASKTAPAKLLQGETVPKPVSPSPGSTKSATPHATVGVNLRDSRVSSSLSDIPSTTSRDEKSSSSSPSHNNSQSCSGDHARTGGASLKEDGRSSSAASSKMPSWSSRPRKSVNGFSVSGASPREAGSSKSASLHRNAAPDKASQSGVTSEKVVDVPPEVNSHKLIVKIPNRVRSPTQRAIGGSVEESSVMISRASSPMHLDRPDQMDAVTEERVDASQVSASSDANAESWQGNDTRDTLTACEEGDKPVNAVPDEEHSKADEGTNKMQEIPKPTASSPTIPLKLVKAQEVSMSSMKALIESCKYSESNAPIAIADDMGMNLLASVAIGEMFKSELASPAGSSHENPLSKDPSCRGSDSDMKLFPQDSHSHDYHSSKDLGSECTHKDHPESCEPKYGGGDSKTSPLCHDELAGGKQDMCLDSSIVDAVQTAAPSSEGNKIRNGLARAASVAQTEIHSEGGKESKAQVLSEVPSSDGILDVKEKFDALILPEDRVNGNNVGVKSEDESAEVGSLSGKEGGEPVKDSGCRSRVGADSTGKILPEASNEQEIKTSDGLNTAEVCDVDSVNKYMQNEKPDPSVILGVQAVAGPASGIKEHLESGVVSERKFGEAVSKPPSDLTWRDRDGRGKFRGYEVPRIKEGNETENCTSGGNSSVVRPLDGDTKLEFDLNEGFNSEDGKFGESINSGIAASSAPVVPLISQLPVVSSASPASLPAPIAVAAAPAKGPLVPPNDLLKAKVEIGWKGSAATSAFRPAEPRKIVEMATGTAYTTQSPDISSGRQSRPPLDFDLNVADERMIEDAAPLSSPLEISSLYKSKSNFEKVHQEMSGSTSARSSGGLGLDLNLADEAPMDCANYSTSNGCRPDVGVGRDFDLNDGPSVDAAEPSTSGQQQLRTSMLSHQQPVAGLRINSAEMGNFSNWFHSASSYSAVSVPAILSDRGEQSFPIVGAGGPPRMLGPSGAGIPFNTEIYRGPVLSSSPAMPFPSAPFQYSIFPFGSSFPLPSATLSGTPSTFVDPSSGGRVGFPPVHSQLVGPSGAVTSQFPRPYIVSLSDGSGNSVVESSKKWNRHGLDLNSGPGGPELEVRDETSHLVPRQLSVTGQQALTEEQARMYQVSSGLLKRKEPESGWDGYRQSSWQR